MAEKVSNTLSYVKWHHAIPTYSCTIYVWSKKNIILLLGPSISNKCGKYLAKNCVPDNIETHA